MRIESRSSVVKDSTGDRKYIRIISIMYLFYIYLKIIYVLYIFMYKCYEFQS